MAAASSRINRYLVAALPLSAGAVASADIIHQEFTYTFSPNQWAALTIGESQLMFYHGSRSTSYLGGIGVQNFALAYGYNAAWLVNESTSGPFYGAAMFASGQQIGSGSGGRASYALLMNQVEWSDGAGKTYVAASGGPWGTEVVDSSREVRGYMGFTLDAAEGAGSYNGWVDIGWNAASASLTFYGYAYETEVNKAITAGATESAPVVPGAPTAVGLMGLAAGAAGIRRKRSA